MVERDHLPVEREANQRTAFTLWVWGGGGGRGGGGGEGHLLVGLLDLRERELARGAAQVEGGGVALARPALDADDGAHLLRHARVLVEQLLLRHLGTAKAADRLSA